MATGHREHSQRRGFPRRRAPRLDLDAAAIGVGMVPAFQPIVSLAGGATVGFEALARWPDLPGVAPDRVFRHAAALGTVDRLDRSCIDGAIAAALRSPLSRGALLCVNTEPSTPYLGRADDALLSLGHEHLSLMYEVTERNMLAHPQLLLRKVGALRADGFTIALDDVGAQPDSLLLLDVISPDVVKLDLALVQAQPTHAQARTLNAVLAHRERTNAVILAEGIENEAHLEQALAVGATLGQGYLFGRPGPLDHDATAAWLPPMQPAPPRGGAPSPFELLSGTAPVRTARRETLTALSRHIETQAREAADPPMVFTALQRDEYFTGTTRRRYRDLASKSPLVAVFGQGMSSDLGAGVRGVDLLATDPLCAEWTVVTLGPHNATALIAREHDANSTVPDGDRRFDFVVTYDRALVTAAVRGLLDRMP